jgi:hypothetical protein
MPTPCTGCAAISGHKAPHHSCGACPQLRAGDACALREGTELRPGNRRHHGGRTSEGREAAVDACDDILAPHDVRIAHNALGDELRVLDEVGRRVDHARDEAFPVGQLHFFEDVPLVLVAGVGALEADRRGPCLQHRLDDLTQRNIVVVRALVVAPAEMQAHLLGRDVFGRSVEHLEVEVDDLAKFWPGWIYGFIYETAGSRVKQRTGKSPTQPLCVAAQNTRDGLIRGVSCMYTTATRLTWRTLPVTCAL